jgi:prepilin-type N-terminal cleavage/methylation domain-containing protein
MRRQLSIFHQDKRGFTLTEVIMATAIIGIITPMIFSLFTTVMEGLTSYEASLSLKKLNQSSINTVISRLNTNKKLLDRGTPYLGYIGTVSPAPLSGTTLPLITPDGSLASATTDFIINNVGNSILLAANDSQISLSSAAMIDVYRFYYYYLTEENSIIVAGKKVYKLVEWSSIRYADAGELDTFGADVIGNLAGRGITAAWDPNNDTFYQLDASEGKVLIALPSITKDKHLILTQALGSNGDFRCGISGNNTSLPDVPPECQVPLYAVANAEYPSGFEVVIVGQSFCRSILLRTVHAARITHKKTMYKNLQSIAYVKDL